ncbi:CDP-diacylglycerol diphosphatase [Nostoc punctiforme FACHB-252]|uniref:CDP-diacylglycerol diphosphatase n=1 Tax=Nostoc punctiforme FACHB-252 TaxID=1357509 RepID=A0ABR8HG43_NOSPU|nr:CDP-diacylglycerol diphosphatase [Nostoc punctiforme]MBD2614311.1 CDP-diacylglycerol diphosphatase [Nostoc punctiforme FACHB-252]
MNLNLFFKLNIIRNKRIFNNNFFKINYLILILLVSVNELSFINIFRSQTLAQSDRDFLWQKVQQCVANQQGQPPKPDPCLYVDLNKRYVVANGSNPVEYLLLPTDKIEGIEDPNISRSNSIPYWQYAWEEARKYVPTKKPQVQYRNQYGLAINSQQARNQDQLHIHMSCIKQSVSMQLEKDDNQIPNGNFNNFILTLENNQYNIMKLDNDSLTNNNNPFYLVNRSLASSQKMADQSIAVVGRRRGGYYILNTESDATKGYKAAAEKLLDEDCSTQ